MPRKEIIACVIMIRSTKRSHKLQVTSYRLQVVGCRLQITGS
jgi:hypothetical protein